MVLLVSVILMIVVSYQREKGTRLNVLFEKPFVLRLGCVIGLLFVIMIFGIYGPGYSASSFIYEGF